MIDLNTKQTNRIKELLDSKFDLTNVVPMIGGDTPPPSGFWLQDLPLATVFLARPKPNGQNMKRGLELTEYGIFNKLVKSTLLLVKQPGQTIPVWVDTKLFSNEVEFFEVLRTQDEQILAMLTQIKKEQENVSDDSGSIRSVGLPADAGHQV